MPYRIDDTIGALASPPGPGGRGIVRVSGPDAAGVLQHLFYPDDRQRWQELLGAAVHAGSLSVADVLAPIPVLIYRWPEGRSYTGQSLVEIHTAGSPPLLEAILEQIYRQGVRPAAAGEFTARAFLSGRLDLIQAEAIRGVIDAPDHQQLQRALRQLSGGVSGKVADIRSDLLNLLADIEAGLDFVEEDIHFVSRSEISRRLQAGVHALEGLLSQCHSRMESKPRRRIVLAGLPNAGKSTLYNALLHREAALVSASAGTTRDYLVTAVDWCGIPVELVDTPGWQEGGHPIDQQAQELAGQQWEHADLLLWCSASDADPATQRRDSVQLEQFRRRNSLLRVWTKADLAGERIPLDAPTVCAQTGAGLNALVIAAIEMLSEFSEGSAELLGSTAARCGESLHHAAESLRRAGQNVDRAVGDELIAVELREALDHLGRIVGAVYTDDILDRVFSRFCIGK